jgi:predicted homoserine dehydrogenase-like protein
MSHPQLTAELVRRQEEGRPITVGLAGAGQMGTDIVVQIALMAGMRLGAISEVRPQAAIDAALLAGHAREDIVLAKTSSDIDRAIEGGRLAITEDLNALAAAGRIDVIIDATGNPNIGTLFALEVMRNGKHIVMLNVEADITIGRFLKDEARKAGVVYTGAAGDEPACTLEIISFAKSLGFGIVAAGKGKNNPLKIDAMPADYQQEAEARNMNARMLVEFVDGSKTAIEMVAIAYATGLVPDVPGMHGPTATLEQLADVLCPKADGGVLSRKGVVDYSIGKGVAPGVFCVIETKHPRVLERMIDLKVGKGPYFTIFRPYHLTSLEVPLSAARAVAFHQADMEPLDRPVAEAVAVAKSDLSAGQSLGMIGENDYRGFAMTWEDARHKGAIPLGLAEKAKVIKPLKAGEFLTYENCVPDDNMVITQIRKRLDQRDSQFLTTQVA